jgi:uncharacterized membrane protein
MCVFLVALLINNWSTTEPKNNMLFSITLPYERLNDNSIVDIVKHFKKICIYLFILFSIAIIPIFFIKYESLSYLYLCTWIILLLLINSYIIKKHRQLIYSLKEKNNWLKEYTHIINIDTKVTLLKGKMPLNKLWFLPCILINLIFLFIQFQQEFDKKAFSLNILSIFIVFINYYIYRRISKASSNVYCDNTDINLACNSVYKRLWTTCWIILSYIVSICLAIFSLYGFQNQYGSQIFMSIILFISLSNLGIIVLIRNKVQFSQNQLLRAVHGSIYNDDDEYWINGFYNNPNDKRISQERRIGYGLEFNMATLTGKLITYGILFVVIIILFAVFIYKINIDFFQ